MEKLYSLLFSTLPGELMAATVIYIAGYATSKFLGRVNQKRKISILAHRTEIAFKAIEVAEQKYPKAGEGAKRLDTATHYLMENAKIKKYEEAQNLILQCFPLTKLYHN